MDGDFLESQPPLPPALRAVGWFAAVCALGAFLVATSPRAPLHGAGGAELVATAAAALTAILAAVAAFQMGVQDGQGGRAWMLLPALPLAAWLAALVVGCVASSGAPGAWGSAPGEALQCLGFLAGVSLPLGGLLVAMLSGYRPERGVAFATGGLAAAAAASGLLNLVHPHASSLLDLGVHLLAAAAAVVLCAQAGSWTRTRAAAGTVCSSK
jgi:hypothetical protein